MRRIAKKEDLDLDFFDMRSLILIFLVFAALSFLAMFLYNLFWIRWAIIAAVLLSLIIFHKKVIAMVKSVLVRK